MSSPDLFYPQHFKKTRPYVKEFFAGLDVLRAAKTIHPKTCYSLSAKAVLGAYKTSGITVGGPEFDTHKFTVENNASLLFAEWTEQGAALFTFKQPLTEALMASGVGEVSIADLRFPFDLAYFHFGAQPGLVLQSGAPVTGAYVLWNPDQLRISLTAPLPAETPWQERWAEVYGLRILSSHFDKSIESAIVHALADDVEDIRQAADSIAALPGTRIGTDALLAAHAANESTFSRCLQLIANAICYITAFPEDALTDWQEDTPVKMKFKADTASPKEAGRATSKLNAMGYRKVRYIGGEFSVASASAEVGHISPHWRRGHWRSQPYGPQMSLRKLKWLKPTRVMGGAVSDEPRVYSTAKTDQK